MKLESFLNKDFSDNLYKGSLYDVFSKDSSGSKINITDISPSKIVEISSKEKFLSSLKSKFEAKILGQEEKEEFIPFLIKYFEITAYNWMIVPVHHREIGNMGHIIFINKNIEKDRLDYNKRDEALATVWASLTKIFFTINDYHNSSEHTTSKVWKLNDIMTEGLAWINLQKIINLLETKLPEFFGIKRANWYLWDHKRQEIYKIIEEEDGKEKLIFFSNQNGIAGKVSNEGKPIMTNNVISYFQFNHEVDDPEGKYHDILGTPEEGVVNIWTIPIFWFNSELGDSYQHFPIAVIQMINKVNKMPFLKSELMDMDRSSQFIGQILSRIILKH